MINSMDYLRRDSSSFVRDMDLRRDTAAGTASPAPALDACPLPFSIRGESGSSW